MYTGTWMPIMLHVVTNVRVKKVTDIQLTISGFCDGGNERVNLSVHGTFKRRQWQILMTALETTSHCAKAWQQAYMTGTTSFVLLIDQASKCSNTNGQQTTKGANRKTKREGKRIMLVDMSISMVHSIPKNSCQSS